MDATALFSKYSKQIIKDAIKNNNDLINTVKTELSKLTIEVSHAHFESAKQALAASFKSNNRERELGLCVGHLRDAFNIAKRQRSAKKSNSYLFGMIKSEEEMFTKSQLIIISAYLIMLCQIISEIYKELGEKDNSLTWENEIRSMQPDVFSLFDIEGIIRTDQYELAKKMADDMVERELGVLLLLARINPRYVTSESYSEDYVSPSGATHRARLKLTFSSEGKAFLKRVMS